MRSLLYFDRGVDDWSHKLKPLVLDFEHLDLLCVCVEHLGDDRVVLLIFWG